MVHRTVGDDLQGLSPMIYTVGSDTQKETVMANKLLVRISVERARDPRNDLTDAEIKSLAARRDELLKKLGGSTVVGFGSLTARHFLVLAFPDVDAWRAFQSSAIARSSEERQSIGLAKYWDFDIDVGFETDF